MNFEKLKQYIREELDIPEWQPSEHEITLVDQLIRAKGPKTKEDLAEIVKEACNWQQCWGMEGIDNSDLNAILLMAAQPRKAK